MSTREDQHYLHNYYSRAAQGYADAVASLPRAMDTSEPEYLAWLVLCEDKRRECDKAREAMLIGISENPMKRARTANGH